MERDTNLDVQVKYQQKLTRRGHILRYFAVRCNLDSSSAFQTNCAEEAISANGDIKTDLLYVLRQLDEASFPTYRFLLGHIYGVDDVSGVFAQRTSSAVHIEAFSSTASHGLPIRGQSFAELTQEIARTARDRQSTQRCTQKRLLDDANMLAILNARGTIMLNQSFMPVHRLQILKLASLALCLWADLAAAAATEAQYRANALQEAIVERVILMVRDDIYTHLLEASDTISCRMDQNLHIQVLKATVGTWQTMVQRRMPYDRERLSGEVHSLRNLCDESMEIHGIIHEQCCELAMMPENSAQWTTESGSEWTGPLLLDESSRPVPGQLVIPGVERNDLGYWFHV